MFAVFNESAQSIISTAEYQHIITDPPYESMPDIEEWRKHCTGNIVVFCSPKRRPTLPPDEILFWVKQPSTKNTVRKCSSFVEEIMVYHGKAPHVFNRLHWSVMTGVYFDTLIDYNGHPWQKPLSLMEKLVRIYTNVGDVILDPYAGSGTTLKAARLSGRGAIGADTDAKWSTADLPSLW